MADAPKRSLASRAEPLPSDTLGALADATAKVEKQLNAFKADNARLRAEVDSLRQLVEEHAKDADGAISQLNEERQNYTAAIRQQEHARQADMADHANELAEAKVTARAEGRAQALAGFEAELARQRAEV